MSKFLWALVAVSTLALGAALPASAQQISIAGWKQATLPCASDVFIPVVPSGSALVSQYIACAGLVDLNDQQTLSNKVLVNPKLQVPSGQPVSYIGIDTGGNTVTGPGGSGGGGGGGGPITLSGAVTGFGTSSIFTSFETVANSQFIGYGGGIGSGQAQPVNIVGGAGITFHCTAETCTIAATGSGATLNNSQFLGYGAGQGSGTAQPVTIAAGPGASFNCSGQTCTLALSAAGVTGPGSSTAQHVPQWSDSTGTVLGAGLPVSTTGAASAIVESTAGGLIAPSLIQALPNSSLANSSIALSLPTWLTATTNPVALGGTIAIQSASLPANFVLVTPDGTSGVLTPRALAPGDLPLGSATQVGGLQCGAGTTCTAGVISIDSSLGVAGPGTSNNGYVPQWSGTTGNLLATGLPVSTTGAVSALVESTAGGAIANSLIQSLPNSSLANSTIALAVPSWLQVSGSPAALGGTLTVSGSNQAQNLFVATPNGSSGAVALRAIVGADLPQASAASFGAVECGSGTTCSGGVITVSGSGLPTVSNAQFLGYGAGSGSGTAQAVTIAAGTGITFVCSTQTCTIGASGSGGVSGPGSSTNNDVVAWNGTGGSALIDTGILYTNLPTLSGANVFTSTNTFASGNIRVLGSSTGYTTLNSANSTATNFAVTFPAANDTAALLTVSQALTNKTYNGLTVTANGTNTLNIAAGKTLTDTSGVGAVLLLGAAGGGFSAYGGATCTNQFLTVLSGAGSGTCASVATATITNSAVTYAKVQNVAASSLLGNPTGSPAAPSEITLGANCSFTGSVLNCTGSAGTVTGPGSSTNNDVVAFNGTGGTVLKDSGILYTNLPTLSGANVFTSTNTFASGNARILGSSTGYTQLNSANTTATNFTLTIPAANDTAALLAATQAFTNKTYNGLTVTSNGTNTLNIAAGKTLTDTSVAGPVLLLGTTGGGFTGYAGASCTNQFLYAVSAAGTGSCGSVITADITNGNVTYAKIQNVAASTLLGNPTGSPAAPSEITLGTGCSFAGSVLNCGGGSGGISGLVAGQVPIANGTTSLGSSLPLSGTSPAQVVSSTTAAKVNGNLAVWNNGNVIDGGPPTSSGTVTSVQVAPGLTTSPGTQNTGTQAITTTGKISLQTWPVLVTASCTVDTNCQATAGIDSAAQLVANGPGITFLLPASGSGTKSRAYYFGSDGSDPYTVQIAGGTQIFGGCYGGGNNSLYVPVNTDLLVTDLGSTTGISYKCTQITRGGFIAPLQTGSGVAALRFTNIPTANFGVMTLTCHGLTSSVGTDAIYLYVGEGTPSSPTWETGAHYNQQLLYTGGTINNTSASDLISIDTSMSSSTTPLSFSVQIFDMGTSGVYKKALVFENDGNFNRYVTGSSYWSNDTNPLVGLEVIAQTGTISGTCSLKGEP